MTEADRWTEVVSALVADAPEPGPFEDLDAHAALMHKRSRRRGPLVAAAVAMLVLILLATVVLVRVELDDSRSAPAAPPAAADSESESDPQGVRPPTYLELLAECDTAPIEEVNRLGTAETTIGVFDHVTRQSVVIDAREFCRAAVELSPDPIGDMTASITMENGQIVAHYYEKVMTLSGPEGAQTATMTDGKPIPPDIAAAKVAQYHAQQADR